jgi:tape measure domain-containing protein
MVFSRAFQDIGVKLIVAGMADFTSKLARAGRNIADFGKKTEESAQKAGILSKALSGLAGFLKGVAQIATGILIAGLIRRLASGFLELATALFETGARAQEFAIRLEGLIARELVQKGVIEEVSTVFRKASEDEILLRDILMDKIDKQVKKIARLTATTGANSIQTRLAKKELKELEQELSALGITSDGLVASQIVSRESTVSFAEALKQATPIVRSLIGWIERLAIQTPFDIEDITNVFTLASSYGFATEKSKELTQAVINFSAGMGLGNQEMVRIIENLGQMVQQGKITGTELRDLGRGAFVPINRLLQLTAERLGITTEELNDLRKKGLAPVDPLLDAFIQMVGEDFPNAGKRASRTFNAVIGNIKDLFIGLIGFEVIKPILDVIAAPLADIIDAISSLPGFTERIRGVGTAIAEMVGALLNILLPGTEEVATKIDKALKILAVRVAVFKDKFIAALQTLKEKGLIPFLEELGAPEGFITFVEKLIDFFEKVKIFATETVPKVVKAFKEGGLKAALKELGVPQSILDSIDNLEKAWNNVKTFWENNKEQILEALGKIFGSAGEFGVATGESILEKLSTTFVTWSEWLVDKGPSIANTITQVADAIADKVVPALIDFGDWILENDVRTIAFFLLLKGVFDDNTSALDLLNGPLVKLVGLLIALGIFLSPILVPLALVAAAMFLAAAAGKELHRWMEGIKKIAGVPLVWKIDVQVSGLEKLPTNLKGGGGGNGSGGGGGNKRESLLADMFSSALMPQGFSRAMQPSISSTTISTVQNFNLNINSSAPIEPVVADFRILESLGSGV